jgi:Tfp pilus assembly protein PilP
MNTKRLIVWGCLVTLAAATAPAQTPPEKPPAAAQKETQPGLPVVKPIPVFSYDPAGRRDPFKDLMAGKEIKEKRIISGLADLTIEEVRLLGIVKTKDKLEAIAGLAEGFPLTIREGDVLADGYVLSIRPDAVVFRKTKDKGIPLLRPRDIVKEITLEERTHD